MSFKILTVDDPEKLVSFEQLKEVNPFTSVMLKVWSDTTGQYLKHTNFLPVSNEGLFVAMGSDIQGLWFEVLSEVLEIINNPETQPDLDPDEYITAKSIPYKVPLYGGFDDANARLDYEQWHMPGRQFSILGSKLSQLLPKCIPLSLNIPLPLEEDREYCLLNDEVADELIEQAVEQLIVTYGNLLDKEALSPDSRAVSELIMAAAYNQLYVPQEGVNLNWDQLSGDPDQDRETIFAANLQAEMYRQTVSIDSEV